VLVRLSWLQLVGPRRARRQRWHWDGWRRRNGCGGAVPVVERGQVLVVPEVGAAPAAEAGPAALAAVQVGVGMGLAGGLEPAAVVVRGTGPGGGGGTGSGGAGGGGYGGGGGTGPGGGGGGTGTGGGVGGPGGEGTTPGKWLTASALLRGGAAPGVAGLPGAGTGTGGGGFSVEEEDVRSMLGLFAQLGKSRKDSEHRMDVPTFQSRLSAMPVRAQYTLQQALAGLAAQAPDAKPDKPMLLETGGARGDPLRAGQLRKREKLRVNAVKQLLDRMNTEIEALRKILSTQEEMMSQAGLSVQSYTELLDQEFWEQVPEENKKEVLTFG